MKLPTMADENAENIWKTMAWASYDGDVPVMKAPRSLLRWRTSTWCLGRAREACGCLNMERRGVGHVLWQTGLAKARTGCKK